MQRTAEAEGVQLDEMVSVLRNNLAAVIGAGVLVVGLVAIIAYAGRGQTQPTADADEVRIRMEKRLGEIEAKVQLIQSKIDAYRQQQAIPTKAGEAVSDNDEARHVSRSPVDARKHIRVSGVSVAEANAALFSAGVMKAGHQDAIDHETVAAITQFQRKHGLRADGVIGPKTWGKLQSDAARHG